MLNKNDGRIKLFLISKVLETRNQYTDLFLKGEYVPLEIQGELNKYVIAFARKLGDLWAITVVPRFSREFTDQKHQWKDAFLSLPPEAPQQWENALTGERLSIQGNIPLDEMFLHFPVAFLISGI